LFLENLKINNQLREEVVLENLKTTFPLRTTPPSSPRSKKKVTWISVVVSNILSGGTMLNPAIATAMFVSGYGSPGAAHALLLYWGASFVGCMLAGASLWLCSLDAYEKAAVLRSISTFSPFLSEGVATFFLTLVAVLFSFSDHLDASAAALTLGSVIFGLVHVFGRISGAHFSPSITFSMMIHGTTTIFIGFM
jgi:glycerol uptake facilitator-like aquaporin